MARRQGNSTWIQYGYNNWKVGYCETQKCRISSFCPCSICFLFQLFTILAYSADVNFVEKAISVCLSVCVCVNVQSHFGQGIFRTFLPSISLCPSVLVCPPPPYRSPWAQLNCSVVFIRCFCSALISEPSRVSFFPLAFRSRARVYAIWHFIHRCKGVGVCVYASVWYVHEFGILFHQKKEKRKKEKKVKQRKNNT